MTDDSTELLILKQQNNFAEKLDKDGCQFGQLTEITVANYIKKNESKLGSFQTTANIMFDATKKNEEKLNNMINMIEAAKTKADKAYSKSEDMEVNFNKALIGLLLKFFLMIVGATLLSNGVIFLGIKLFAR